MKKKLFIFFFSSFLNAKIDITQKDVFGKFGNTPSYKLQHAGTKYQTPRALRVTGSKSNLSFLRPLKATKAGTGVINPAIKHPGAAELFPDNAGLQGLFTTFLNGLDQEPYFTVFFAQLHLLILHQLYQYLLRIYATFNLSTTPNLEQYLQDQATYALNRKTILINHLINIIEAQTNGAISTRFPRMPKELATHAGILLLKNDYGTDLNIMLEEYELQMFSDEALRANGVPESEITVKKNTFKQVRSTYSKLFGSYLRFAKEHCGYLALPLTDKDFTGLTQFVAHAQKIKTVMDQEMSKISALVKNEKQTKQKQQIDPLNPPLFFYDAETMRGIKVIPCIAQSLPKSSQSVGWPTKATQTLVNTTFAMAANQSALFGPAGSPYDNKTIAFYADSNGNILGSTVGPRLFVNIMTAQDLYAQELYKQPAWMNSPEGIIKMTRACLGDFSMLLEVDLRDEPILDPCLFCVLANAAKEGGIAVQPSSEKCSACSAYLQGIKKQVDLMQKTANESIDPNAGTDDQQAGGIPDDPFASGGV